MKSSDPVSDLQDHFETCCMEHIAQINGPGEWRLNGEIYDVDFDVVEGPVELVRRSDQQRMKVDVSVSVWEPS
jgi:hypothetical protein